MSGAARRAPKLNRRPVPIARRAGGARRVAPGRVVRRADRWGGGLFCALLLAVAAAFSLATAFSDRAAAAAAPGTPVTLAVDGQAPVQVAASLVAGTVYLPAEGVASALGVDSSRLADGVVRWALTDRQVTLDWNAAVIQVGDREEPINPAPLQVDGETYLPVSFVAELFDLRIQWEQSLGTLALIPRDGRPRLRDPSAPSGRTAAEGEVGASGRLPPDDGAPSNFRSDGAGAGWVDPEQAEEDDVLEWRGPRLKGEADETWSRKLALDVLGLSPVESIRMGTESGRPALVIGVRGESEADVALLTDPARLVVDLDGAILDSALEEDVGRGSVLRLRAAQTSLDSTRVVLDLAHPVGYDLRRSPEGDGWLVVLQNLVSDVVIRREEGRAKLYVNTSSAPAYEAHLLQDPLRLVLDFEESTFHGGGRDIPVDDPLVRGIRMSQFTPDVVRVVLDLADATRAVEVPFIPSNLDWDGDDASASDRDATGGGAGPSGWTSALAFELLAPLRDVSLQASGEVVELTLASQGVLEPQLFYERDPTRLIVDVPGVFLHAAGTSSVDALADRLGQAAGGVVTGVEVEPAPGGPAHRVRLAVETDGLQPYEVTSSDGGRRVAVRIGKPGRPEHLVVIDPGHGGVDPGAVGPDGALEKDYTLDISKRLADLLEEAGIGVVLTRTDDRFVELAERPEIAERLGADVFLSIHVNAAVNEAPSGTETLYSPILPANHTLALTVQRELVRVLSTVNRGLRARPELAVLRRAVMPAALVEVAFIQNPYDGEQLKKAGFRQRAAEGIFNGVLAFLGVDERGEEAAQ